MNLNKVFKKLPKEKEVELSKEEIELGMTDDFRKAEKKANSSAIKAIDLVDTSKGFLSKAEAQLKDAINDYENAILIFEKLEKAVKDLGVPLPSNLDKSKNSVKANMQDAEKSLKSIQKAASTIVR